MSAHWARVPQDDLVKGGGSHRAGLVVAKLCGEVGGEDEEEAVSVALSVDLTTLVVGAQAFHLHAWAWENKKWPKD